jgi:hypothetical protein
MEILYIRGPIGKNHEKIQKNYRDTCFYTYIRYYPVLVIFSLLVLYCIFFLVDITENKKLRKFIFDRLFEELSGKIYYPYGRELWIIDFEGRDWYFQYNSDGTLYYNYTFFESFFRVFSFSHSQYQKILKEWFENSLNHQINQISRRKITIDYYIDGMQRTETKKWSINERYGYGYGVVRRYLDLKKYNSEENIKLDSFLTENGVY